MGFNGAGAASGAAAGSAFMPGIGTAIGAVAGGLLGGLQGGGDDFSRTDYWEQLRLQNEWSQVAFRDRLRLADKMGVHRLYALGQPITFPNAIPTGRSSRGVDLSGIGSAIEKMAPLSEEQREVQRLTVEQIKAGIAKDNAQALYWNSEAARNAQSARVSAPTPSGGAVVAGDIGLRAKPGLVKAKPDEVVSANPNAPEMTAGEHPAWKPYVIGETGSGRKMYGVWTNNDEGFGSDMDMTAIPSWVGETVRRFGIRGLYDAAGLGGYVDWAQGVRKRFVEDQRKRYERYRAFERSRGR